MGGPKKQFPRSDVLAKARRRLGLAIDPGRQDREGLLALTHLLYPTLDISDPRYVTWQYDQNPAGPAYERIGRIENRTVGQYTVIPQRFQLSTGIVKGSLSVNTMTHPDYRGQGMFMLLAEEVFKACEADGAKLTLGFPNPNSYKGFLKHLDFKDIGALPLWILPLDLGRLTQTGPAKRMKFLQPILKLGAPLWNAYLAARGLNKKSPYRISRTSSIDKSFDAFWETVKTDYQNLTVRDQNYLKWRFTDHPTRQYVVYMASADDRLLGYIVVRNTAVQDVPCGMIVDLLVPATSQGHAIAKDLIREVTRTFRADGAGLAGCLAPENSPAAAALKSCGYMRCPETVLPQPFPVILRWNTPDTPPDDVFNLSHWYLTMGDYDAA